MFLNWNLENNIHTKVEDSQCQVYIPKEISNSNKESSLKTTTHSDIPPNDQPFFKSLEICWAARQQHPYQNISLKLLELLNLIEVAVRQEVSMDSKKKKKKGHFYLSTKSPVFSVESSQVNQYLPGNSMKSVSVKWRLQNGYKMQTWLTWITCFFSFTTENVQINTLK